ncbi:MAG: penicillin-binding transpeptidase domain-containing protein [Gammaproteobacteria bacterium]
MRRRQRAAVLPGAALAALLLAAGAASADPGSGALEQLFGDYEGCALLLERDRHHERHLELGASQCRTARSPCSTFKMPNALIGLETGVVSGPHDVRRWDGVQRPRRESNRDHDLESAFRQSIVWYFQALARDVGEARMQTWIDRLGYGNRDLSGGIDRFWLGSSLAIDAHGQLDLLRRLHHGALPFRPAHQQTVRELMRQDSPLPGTLHGKTGSCLNGDAPDHGWFVGWVDWADGTASNPRTTGFAVNVAGDGANGAAARKMALELLSRPLPVAPRESND